MVKSRIIGTGSYVPEKVLTNEDIERMVDTSDEWIRERTGIRERRLAADNQSTSDLACEASKRALGMAGLAAADLDMIIVATMSPDMLIPSTACFLQRLLGATNAAAFDINAACSGFLYALSVGNSYVKSGDYGTVLVVGSEILSRFTDWKDRSTCVLFGDGAGAVILRRTKGDSGILSVRVHADGTLWQTINLPGGGATNPSSEETIRQRLHYIKMKGNETFKIAVRTLEAIAVETLAENGLKPEDLSLLVPHQANQRILQATAKRLGLPGEKVVMNLDRYGNTSAASIPIALDEAVRGGRIKEGDYILLEAFGGGLTWASALIRW